jgi:probable HAF family extracellular repeat protein
MKKFVFISFIIVTPFITQAQGWFKGVGQLPDATTSRVDAVSPNGRYVVGQSGSNAFIWTASFDTLIGLGDSSWQAKGVSNDGVVAGIGSIGGTIAFRWSQDSGMVNLGNLGFYQPESRAFDISEDGNVIVGWSYSEVTQEAFQWTAATGMISLGLLTGGYQHEALAVSGNGLIAVGDGRTADGDRQAILWNGGPNGLEFLVDSLPGGHTNFSVANDITPDGMTIVGESYYDCIINTCYHQAVIWRGSGSPEPLGFLPNYTRSRALAVSGDGSVIVGQQSISGGLGVPVIWDSAGQPRILKEMLETDYGLDLSNWELKEVTDISANGKVIVGWGINPDGLQEGWVAILGISIVRPSQDYKFIAGTKDTIKWVGGIPGSLLEIEYSADDGKTFHWMEGALVDDRFYVWDIPDTLLSTKCKIRVTDWNDTSITDVSNKFRIKPYIITRLDENNDYIAYDTYTDRWGFGNNETDMWPSSYWQKFNYQGIDPFTEDLYSNWQGFYVFALSQPDDFPDWESFVRTFAVDACYISTTLNIYSPTALKRWARIKGNWRGSCYGISTSNALAFSHKQEFINRYPNFPSFNSPISVQSNSSVIPVISELFIHQFGNPSREYRKARWKTITPNQTLNEIKSMLFVDDVEIKTLTMWSNSNKKLAHSILPYELEQDDSQEELYYLYVYDNAYPDSINAIIVIDTTGNSNNGEWLPTYAWNDWGGDSLIALEIEASIFLNNAILPKRSSGFVSPFIMAGEDLEISSNLDANIRILDNLGNLTGFVSGSVFSEIPNSVPFNYLNPSETSPYGYYLPTDDYSVQIDGVESDTIQTVFFTGNKILSYERTGATNTQTDRLFFDGGVSAVNPDQVDKTITLVNIINESTDEKLFALRQIDLAQNDSVKIENPDDNQLKFISYGSEKNYQIELNFATQLGLGRFVNNDIAITQNTTHLLVPNWGDFADLQLTIYLDVGNDGTIEDTLYITNEVTDVGDDQGSLMPTEYRLEQNYPNPFNPTTTISYSIPKEGFVTLKVYNAIGEEIAIVVNEVKQVGNYSVTFDASNLPSGIYVYQLKVNSFIETKKMILMK